MDEIRMVNIVGATVVLRLVLVPWLGLVLRLVLVTWGEGGGWRNAA